MSDDPWAIKLREENLNRIFGDGVFERLVCLGCGDDKDEALERYRDSDFIWVEDKPENADLGSRMGMSSFLIEHPYNKDVVVDENVTRVSNWKEIYEHVG
jgi:uncharacterized HAD superfamily protein